MDTVPQNSVKIDRLSSLPTELLLSIFDLAYDLDQLLLEPLSKRLLPYFRRNLYRQIRLSSRSSWSKLLRTVKDSRGLGELVLDLDTSAAYAPQYRGRFEEIVKPFPRLISLKTGYIQPIGYTSIDLVPPPLQHFFYECDTLNITAIDFLANLNLSTLEIDFYSTNVILRPSPLPHLESLNKLSLVCQVHEEDDLEGIVWESSLANIINCCPKITSLRLFDPDYPDFRALLSNATSFAPRITSLELDSPALTEAYNICCDHLLPQFSDLTHLTLGDGTPSASLPTNLRRLPLLTSLRLGPDAYWNFAASDFFTLLQGPARHPSLQDLVFECFGGRVGRRIEIDGDVDERVWTSMEIDGWIKPTTVENFGSYDGQRLRRVCSASGIHLNGDPAGLALQIKEEFDLEDANRSVLRCLQLKTLDDVKLHGVYPRFSHIPIDSLDPQNLKLVKTDLPEKRWFRLSLE